MKCIQCEKEAEALLPDPRDSEQEFQVCVPCEYEITERACALSEESHGI